MPKKRSATNMGKAVAWLRTNPRMKTGRTVHEIAAETGLPKTAIRNAIDELNANDVLVKTVLNRRGYIMAYWTDWYAQKMEAKASTPEQPQEAPDAA